MNKPQFLLRYWLKEKPNQPPTVKYGVFNSEDDLIATIKNVRGNYNVFLIGAEYESPAYFNRLFDAERVDEERQTYLKLKQKFEGNG